MVIIHLTFGFHFMLPITFQALSNVPPLRNYFLEEENYRGIRRPPGDIMFLLVQRFGELMRKLWNPRNFKAHVSPHEMLQAVVLCSKKTFQITKQGPSRTVYALLLGTAWYCCNGPCRDFHPLNVILKEGSPHFRGWSILNKPCRSVFCAGDAVDFLSWFLNALHNALGGTKKKPCK